MLNIWKNGISKELEYLQCHCPAERPEKKWFSVEEFKLSFSLEGGPYSGPSNYIPGQCVGEERVVISQLCWDPQGCQMCPSWQQGY